MLAGVQPSMPVGEPVITTAPVFAVALIAATPCLQVEIHAGEVDADDLVPHRLSADRPTLPSRAAKKMPALETSDVEPAEAGRPSRLKAASTSASLPTSAVRAIASPPALQDLSAVVPRPLGVPVDDGDLAAFLGEPLGRRLADARPGAGDRRHLALQPTHERPPGLLPRCGRLGIRVLL